MLTRCPWFLSVGGPGAPRPPTVHLGLVEAVDHRPRRRLLRALRGQGARGGGLVRFPRRIRRGALLARLGRQPARPGRRAVRRSQQRHHEALAALEPIPMRQPIVERTNERTSEEASERTSVDFFRTRAPPGRRKRRVASIR